MNPKSVMLSIADVAREANVAPSTVSLVLNRSGRVSDATRQRVERVIQRVGYRPRPAGRPRRKAPPRHIAAVYTRRMIVEGQTVNWCGQCLAAMMEQVSRAKVHVSTVAGAGHVSEDPVFAEMLRDGRVSGIVLIGVWPEDGFFQAAQAAGVPAVLIERRPERSEFSSVCLDYYGSGQKAVQHLLGLGHRRLGHLAAHPDMWYTRDYRAGICDVLKPHGLDLAFAHTYTDPPREAGFRQLCREMIAAGVTAVIAGDYDARNLADAFADLGVAVPQQVSIIGFDHLGLRTRQGLQLASMDYDKALMGRLAGEMVLRLSDPAESVRGLSAWIETHLVEGQTIAPPPQVPSSG